MPSTLDLHHLRQTRMITAAVCYSTPLACFVVYLFAILQGDPMGFFVGFAEFPWTNPLALALVLPAFVTTGLAIAVYQGALNQALRGQPPPQAFRTRHILTSALFEATAIFGLVLGFVVGPITASAALLFFVVPVIGGTVILPSEHALVS